MSGMGLRCLSTGVGVNRVGDINRIDQQRTVIFRPQPRFPNYFSLDMRVSKDVQVNPQHAVRLSLTMRNLTNHFNRLEVHSNLAAPQYGRFFGDYNRKFLFDFDFLF